MEFHTFSPICRLIKFPSKMSDGSSNVPSVLDVSSKDFDVDAYMSMRLKEQSLDQLLKEEEVMVTAVLLVLSGHKMKSSRFEGLTPMFTS